MEKINREYEIHCGIPSDIHEHLPVLKEYAQKCKHITEMGVRGVVSSWAFLAAAPEKLISYDIETHPNIGSAIRLVSQSVDWEFIQADVLKIEIEPTELLFIDTLHIYSQLKKELELHAKNVSKYIILHDTSTYCNSPEPLSWQTKNVIPNYIEDDRGLCPAISEFLEENPWVIEKKLENNNGLTILARVK